MSRLTGNASGGPQHSLPPQHATPATLPLRPLHNPLTSEDEAVLDNAIHKTAVHADLTARMKEAGLDVSDAEGRNAMHHHVASTLKKMFFPTNLVPPAS